MFCINVFFFHNTNFCVTLFRTRQLKKLKVEYFTEQKKKGKPFTERQKLRNKLIGKTLFKVERTFGSIKRWFKSTDTLYNGIAKTHTQDLIEVIAHNLYRAPGIVASNSIKMTK